MSIKKGEIRGTFQDCSNRIALNLPVIAFEEDGAQIIYCPALDISGYGVNETEANESFGLTLESFFSYSIHKKTFIDELKRLGWKIKNIHKTMVPPDMASLLSENENFNRIFNNHDFRKFERKITIPVC